MWFRFEGKTRLIDIWGQDWEIEKEARERIGLGKDLYFFMTSEGRTIDWEDLGEIRDGGMIEVGLRMKGGGMKKKKTKTGNPCESLASGGESEGRDCKRRRNLRGTKQKMTSCCRTSRIKQRWKGRRERERGAYA